LKPKKIIIVSAKAISFEKSIEININNLNVKMIIQVPNKNDCLGKRVAVALNKALMEVNLEKYDYILKSDIDIIFPPNFIQKNLKSKYKLIGPGAGMLIETKSFKKLLNGKFLEVCNDDLCIIRIFWMNDMKILPWKWVCKAKYLRKNSRNHWRIFHKGSDLVKCGDPPICYISTKIIKILSLNDPIKQFFLLIGYMYGYKRYIHSNEKKYSFSNSWTKFILKRWENGNIIKKLCANIDIILLRKERSIKKFQ
jgi:hypothetical protein